MEQTAFFGLDRNDVAEENAGEIQVGEGLDSLLLWAGVGERHTEIT